MINVSTYNTYYICCRVETLIVLCLTVILYCPWILTASLYLFLSLAFRILPSGVQGKGPWGPSCLFSFNILYTLHTSNLLEKMSLRHFDSTFGANLSLESLNIKLVIRYLKI